VLLGIAAVKAVLLEALHRSGQLTSVVPAAAAAAAAAAATHDGDDDIVLPAEAVQGLLTGSVRVVAFADEEGIRFK
jgi:hypothetical protein